MHKGKEKLQIYNSKNNFKKKKPSKTNLGFNSLIILAHNYLLLEIIVTIGNY